MDYIFWWMVTYLGCVGWRLTRTPLYTYKFTHIHIGSKELYHRTIGMCMCLHERERVLVVDTADPDCVSVFDSCHVPEVEGLK